MIAGNLPLTRLTMQQAKTSIQRALVAIPTPGVVTFIMVSLVYTLSMSRDFDWSYYGGDGGELITASLTLGIPHPPGYPLYVLVGKAFSYFPFGAVASRYHLLSALSMAVAAAFISQVGHYHYAKSNKAYKALPLQSIIPGLLFAFVPLIWSQAIIAEVYALNLAILSALLWTIMTKRKPLLVGLLLGLGVISHLSSLLMLPLCLVFLAGKGRRKFFAGFALGLLPISFLLIFAAGSSPIIWGKPTTLSEWFWLISARLYQPNIMNFPISSWIDRFSSWLLPFFIPLGIIISMLIRDLPGTAWITDTRGRLAILITAAGYMVYAFGYASSDAMVLLLPAILLIMILLAQVISSSRSNYLILMLMFVLGSLYLVFEKEVPVRSTVEEYFVHIPNGSIVVTPGDQTLAAAWYFAYAESQRPDLIIVDYNLFQFDWYRDHLSELAPSLVRIEEDDFDAFIRVNSGQFDICELSLYENQALDCSMAESL